MNFLITGATGLLGSNLKEYLEQNGHNVSRCTTRLLENPNENDFQNIDVFIHAGYDFSLLKPVDIFTSNVEGSIRLLETAQKMKVNKIIFISTISAFEGCKSFYGKAKLEVEKYCIQNKILVVRPGLIYGDIKNRGIFGALKKMANLPLLPLLDGGLQPMYLIHVKDLCNFIFIASQSNYQSEIFTVAHKNSILLKDLLELIKSKPEKLQVQFYLPSKFLYWVLLLVEFIFNKYFIFKSDSLIGLIHFNPSHDFNNSKSILPIPENFHYNKI